MNFKYFNKGLFANTFSRLKVTGIVFTLICIIISIIIPINRYLQRHVIQEGSNWKRKTEIIEITPVLLLFMFVGVMVLVFSAFSYLNKRKSSDFFQSLPNTKVCTYISMGIAALSWAYITIISTVLLTTLTYSVIGIAVESAYPIYLILAYSACATLVAAACLIAISVTGTIFTSLVVSGLILMLPRLITTLFKIAVTTIAFNSTGAELGVLFDYKYNLPFALVFNGLGIDNEMAIEGVNTLLFYREAILYTFVLAVVYFALGCFLFSKRKSEIAGKSAPNKILQHIYRMSITLPLILLLGVSYSEFLISPAEFLMYYRTEIMLLLILSLIVYFAYELITTKKAKNLVKAIPLYFALTLFALGYGIASKAIGEKILNTTPDPSEVEAISIASNVDHNANGKNDYMTASTHDIKFESEYTIEKICGIIKDEVDKHNGCYDGYYECYIPYHEKGYYTLHLKNGKKVVRQVEVYEYDIRDIQDMKEMNLDYQKASRNLPKGIEIHNIDIPNLSKNQTNKVWNSFKKEVKGLSDEDFSELTREMRLLGHYKDKKDGANYNEYIAKINIDGSVGINPFNSSYYLTMFTPKTTNLYLSFIYEDSIKTFKAETDRLINIDLQNTPSYEYSISFFERMDSEYKYLGVGLYGSPYNKEDDYFGNMAPSQTKRIFEIIKNSGFKKAVVESRFININAILPSENHWQDFFIALSEEEMDKIVEIAKEKKRF